MTLTDRCVGYDADLTANDVTVDDWSELVHDHEGDPGGDDSDTPPAIPHPELSGYKSFHVRTTTNKYMPGNHPDTQNTIIRLHLCRHYLSRDIIKFQKDSIDAMPKEPALPEPDREFNREGRG